MNNEACIQAGAGRSEATESLIPTLSVRDICQEGTISRLHRADTYFRCVVRYNFPADVVISAVDVFEATYDCATNLRQRAV